MTSEYRVSGEEIFQCRNCGKCCEGFGGTYVSPDNIEAIAAYLGLPADHVQETYCRPSGKKVVLAQKPDGYCVFWDTNCTIHPVKPRMCRAWPFIEGVLRAPGNWALMADACPGINPAVPEPALLACVREELSQLETDNTILPRPRLKNRQPGKKST